MMQPQTTTSTTHATILIGKTIRAGAAVGVLAATAVCVGWVLVAALATLRSRTGYPGGEALVIPMIALLLWTGWTAHAAWTEIKGEETKK